MEKILLKRRWDIVNSFEERESRRFLKRLTAKDSFKIFAELYRFSCNFLSRKQLSKIDSDKIKLLSHVHSVFNKVKI